VTLRILRMIEEQFHRDDEDRLIREGRTPAEYIRPGEIEYKACPYAGSRYQHASPMNVSALRQMSAHWDDILASLAVMRVAYAEQRGAAMPAAPELMDLWRVGQLGSALPWFYLLRGDGETRAPAYAAALAKITLGVGLWAQRLLVDLLAGAWTPVELTAQAIYDSSEANGTLIGETEVCSGPEKMMIRFFEVLVAGTPETTSPAIDALVAEREAALLFGAHYTNLKLLLWIHYLARRFLYADLIAALGPRAELVELLEGSCEPPDFFVVGPPDHAAVPPASRALWIGQLAALVVPMAPDGSDRALQTAAMAIGLALGITEPGPETAAELAALHGLAPDAAALAARALATYAKLDAILGDVATTVEDAFRRSDPDASSAWTIDAAARDRLLVQPPRTVLDAISRGSRSLVV
jgi:hypothetical protein